MSQNKGKKDGGEVNRGERGSSTVDNKAPKVAQQNNSIDILLRNIKLPEKTTKEIKQQLGDIEESIESKFYSTDNNVYFASIFED